MTIKYKATCDKVLCIMPAAPTEEEVVGAIIVPAKARKAMEDRNPIRELTVHSIGPDVKSIRVGQKILYNMHQCNPVPHGDQQLVVISESQVFAVIEEVAEPIAVQVEKLPAHVINKPLTIEEIKLGLGVQDAPKDDTPDIPVPPAAVAPVPAATPAT